MNYLEAYYISRDELLVLAKRHPSTHSRIRRAALLMALRRMITALAREARNAHPSERGVASLIGMLQSAARGSRLAVSSRPVSSRPVSARFEGVTPRGAQEKQEKEEEEDGANGDGRLRFRTHSRSVRHGAWGCGT